MSTASPSTEATPTAPGLQAFRGRITHVAYHVSNIDRALAFYVDVLGLVEQMRIPLPNGEHEVVLGFPDSRGGGLILMWDPKREAPYKKGEGYSRLVLMVSDVDAAVDHVAERGTPVVSKPVDAGPMRYALVSDPDGYIIEILQMKRR